MVVISVQQDIQVWINDPDKLLLILLQSLLETITTSEARAQRDNDLIYHKDVPPPSAVSTIQETKLVSPTVPKELLNPSSILQNQRPLFFDLISWGAREAISRYIGASGISRTHSSDIYNDRKETLLDEKISGPARELQDAADKCVRELF